MSKEMETKITLIIDYSDDSHGQVAKSIKENEEVVETADIEKIELYAVEETKINGVRYLLASESPLADEPAGDDEVVYILKDLSSEDDADSVYEFVEDDKELSYLSKIFSELLDDVDFEM